MASTQLSIPQRYRSGAESIAQLTPLERDAIVAALEGVQSFPRTLSQDGISVDLSRPNLEAILVTLKSLYSARARGRQAVAKFARDVVKDLRCRRPELFSSAEAWGAAITNFEELLQIDTLNLASQERSVRAADEKRFCGAQVMVELRPVFGGELADELRRLLVSYRLKLGFHNQGDKHEDLYISLDLADIQALRESLNQAEFQGDILERQARKMLRLEANDVV